MLSSLWEEESLHAHRWGRNSPLGTVKIGMAHLAEFAPTPDSFLFHSWISLTLS